MKLPPFVNWEALNEEAIFSFSASSGPGGQHVNKAHTKATLHWSPAGSRALSDEARRLIQHDPRVQQRSNDCGEVVIIAQSLRSQDQNRADALQRLKDLIVEAIRPRKKRIRTKPTRASRERRLAGKQKHSQRKEGRRKFDRSRAEE